MKTTLTMLLAGCVCFSVTHAQPPVPMQEQTTVKPKQTLQRVASAENQAELVALAPKAVILRPGGQSKTVTIEGKNLERVLSVYVIKEGLVMTEITAKLIAPWPLSRKLELQAATRAPRFKGYQLRAIVKAGTEEKKIDVPLTMFSLGVGGEDLPDLIIYSGSLTPNGSSLGHVIVNGTIKNIGTAPAVFEGGLIGDFSVIDEQGSIASRGQLHAPPGGLSLAPGATFTPTGYTPMVLYIGSREIKFTADPQGKVAESNENNNTYTLAIPQTNLAPPPPPTLYADLTIASVSVNPPSGPPSTRFTITVVVKNIGSADINQSVTVTSSIGGSPQILNSLSAGESKTLAWTLDYSMAPGTKTVTVQVDPFNRVSESNENNNTSTTTFVVQ